METVMMLNGSKKSFFCYSILFLVITLFCTSLLAENTTRVLLVKPLKTAELLHGANAENVATEWISVWDQLLRQVSRDGLIYNIDDESALNQRLNDYDIVMLPGAICLSDVQMRRLREYVNQGGGLFITWAPGSRTENGEWRGYSFVEELMDGAIAESGRLVGEPASIYLRSNAPGTFDIPPGYRLRFALNHSPLYLIPKNEVTVSGYLEDVVYADKDLTRIRREPIFVTREYPRGGRIAWIGANLDGLQIDPINWEQARNLTWGLLQWITGGAQVSISPWPQGKQAAVLIHGDIEDKFDQVTNILDILRRNNLTGTLNILTEEAAVYPLAMQQIKDSNFEIAIHGDKHDVFRGQSFAVQNNRLQRTIKFIEHFGPRPVGFRPPELAFDSLTVEVCKDLDFLYISADHSPDRDYPRYHWTDRSRPELGGIWMLPKSELDDYDIFERHKFTTSQQMWDALRTDFERIYDMGGLYKFAYHSQYLDNTDFLRVINLLSQLINQKHDKLWIAQTKEIMYWAERNRGLLLTVEKNTTKELQISLFNDNDAIVENVVLRILPPKDVVLELFAPISTSRTCSYKIADGLVYVNISRLNPGEDFTATFGKRSGLPVDQRTKNLLHSLQNIFMIGGILFFGGTLYYFIFTRRRKVAKLKEEPDIDVDNEDESPLMKLSRDLTLNETSEDVPETQEVTPTESDSSTLSPTTAESISMFTFAKKKVKETETSPVEESQEKVDSEVAPAKKSVRFLKEKSKKESKDVAQKIIEKETHKDKVAEPIKPEKTKQTDSTRTAILWGKTRLQIEEPVQEEEHYEELYLPKVYKEKGIKVESFKCKGIRVTAPLPPKGSAPLGSRPQKRTPNRQSDTEGTDTPQKNKKPVDDWL